MALGRNNEMESATESSQTTTTTTPPLAVSQSPTDGAGSGSNSNDLNMMLMQIEQIRAQLNRIILGPAPDPFQVEKLSAQLASLLRAVGQGRVEQQGQAAAAYDSVAPYFPLPPPPAYEMVFAAAGADADATPAVPAVYSLHPITHTTPRLSQIPGRMASTPLVLRGIYSIMFAKTDADLHAGFQKLSGCSKEVPEVGLFKALCYLEGFGTTKQVAAARETLQEHKAEPRVKAVLAKSHYDEENYETADVLLNEALEANDPYALLIYARCLLHGIGTLPRPSDAHSTLMRLAQAGSSGPDFAIVQALAEVELMRFDVRVNKPASDLEQRLSRIQMSCIWPACYEAGVVVVEALGHHPGALKAITAAADAKHYPACVLLAQAYDGLATSLLKLQKDISRAMRYRGYAALYQGAEEQVAVANQLCARGDYEVAFELYVTAASLGSIEASAKAGTMLARGQGVEVSYAKAFTHLHRAALAGHKEVYGDLGVCYERGWGVGQDCKKAVEWYTKAAEQGNAGAQFKLGRCYYNGHGVTQDFKQAVEWYAKAAEQGDADAQFNLGVCYYNGHGVTCDYKQAVERFTKAAEQGDADAQFHLGRCYYNGHGVTQDCKQAVEWFTKAAEQGHAVAQSNLGHCYSYGHGVTEDYQKAVEWFTQAAKQGHAVAQFNLGVCYYNGGGATQDCEKAVEWYTKAAEQGDADAQNNLGRCYDNGHGVTQDYEKAVEWYTKAAEQGNAEARFNLGRCYDNGHGVTRDFKQELRE